MKLHHHVLFTQSQYTNSGCFEICKIKMCHLKFSISLFNANTKLTYPKNFSVNRAVQKAKNTSQMSVKIKKERKIDWLLKSQPCLLCCLKFKKAFCWLANQLQLSHQTCFIRIYVNFVFWYSSLHLYIFTVVTDLRADRTSASSLEFSHKLSSAFMAISCCSFCHRCTNILIIINTTTQQSNSSQSHSILKMGFPHTFYKLKKSFLDLINC